MPDSIENERYQIERRAVRVSPDPSLLITRQLILEIVIREIGALKELVFVRLDAMDKAIVLFNENITRVPTDTDKQIGLLKELIFSRFDVQDEKFRSVWAQFHERDVRTEQTSQDSKVAVDAALQAAKEAVGEQNKSNGLAIAKSEAATMKQIDQQGLLIATSNNGLKATLDDLKERLGRIEGEGRGGKDYRANLLALLGGAVGIGGLLFALLKP